MQCDIHKDKNVQIQTLQRIRNIFVILCTWVFPVGASLLYWGGCIYNQQRFQKYSKILLTNITYINAEWRGNPL